MFSKRKTTYIFSKIEAYAPIVSQTTFILGMAKLSKIFFLSIFAVNLFEHFVIYLNISGVDRWLSGAICFTNERPFFERMWVCAQHTSYLVDDG